MPLDLLKRSEVGQALTANQHDANFTAIETVVGSLETSIGNLETPQYLTLAASATLSNERVLTAGTNITLDTTTPGILTISASAGSSLAGITTLNLTAFGLTAGDSISAADSDNTLIGLNAGTTLTTGAFNTIVGAHALEFGTGDENVALGDYCLMNATGSGNVAAGSSSLGNVSTGNGNVGIGRVAGLGITTGSNNVGIGPQALLNAGAGSENVAIGSNAGYGTNGSFTIAIGTESIAPTTGGPFTVNNSIAIGWHTQRRVSASDNVTIGYAAAEFLVSGTRNTVLGTSALNGNVSSSDNTMLGHNAGLSLTGGTNTAVGSRALDGTGSGGDNTAVGYGSLSANMGAAGFNTAVGSLALQVCTSSQNVGIGYNAAGGTTSGNHNTALGFQAGDAVDTGSNNTFLGHNADANLGAASNRTAIGAGASATADNSIFLGNTSVTGIYMGTTARKVVLASKAALTISAGTLSTDASIDSYFTVAMTTNITTFSNPTGLVDGQTVRWRLAQDATGGRTWTGFGTMFKWPGGVIPQLSTGANQVDLLVADYDAASNTLMARLNKNFA